MNSNMRPDVWACAHDDTDLRIRKIQGGSVQYRMQCLRCGSAASPALSQRALAGKPFPAWDDTLQARWQDSRRAIIDERRQAEVEQKRADHGAYLLTPKWRALRLAALERDRGLCQGCRKANAEDVHHLTYANWGDELLFQLVSLCRTCHEKAHRGVADVSA